MVSFFFRFSRRISFLNNEPIIMNYFWFTFSVRSPLGQSLRNPLYLLKKNERRSKYLMPLLLYTQHSMKKTKS